MDPPEFYFGSDPPEVHIFMEKNGKGKKKESLRMGSSSLLTVRKNAFFFSFF